MKHKICKPNNEIHTDAAMKSNFIVLSNDAKGAIDVTVLTVMWMTVTTLMIHRTTYIGDVKIRENAKGAKLSNIKNLYGNVNTPIATVDTVIFILKLKRIKRGLEHFARCGRFRSKKIQQF